MQTLLVNWVERLKLEKEEKKKKLPAEVLEQLYEVSDILYGEGTCHVLAYAIRTGETEAIEKLFKQLPTWYHGTALEGLKFTGNDALLAALEADGKTSPPFRRVVRLVQGMPSGAGSAETNAQLETDLQKALKKYFVAQARQADDLTGLADALDETANPESGPRARTVLTPELDAYLIAQDPAGKEIGRDDDGAGGLNARLIVIPKKTGAHLITATSFERYGQGAYTLIIREFPAKVP